MKRLKSLTMALVALVITMALPVLARAQSQEQEQFDTIKMTHQAVKTRLQNFTAGLEMNPENASNQAALEAMFETAEEKSAELTSLRELNANLKTVANMYDNSENWRAINAADQAEFRTILTEITENEEAITNFTDVYGEYVGIIGYLHIALEGLIIIKEHADAAVQFSDEQFAGPFTSLKEIALVGFDGSLFPEQGGGDPIVGRCWWAFRWAGAQFGEPGTPTVDPLQIRGDLLGFYEAQLSTYNFLSDEFYGWQVTHDEYQVPQWIADVFLAGDPLAHIFDNANNEGYIISNFDDAAGVLYAPCVEYLTHQ